MLIDWYKKRIATKYFMKLTCEIKIRQKERGRKNIFNSFIEMCRNQWNITKKVIIFFLMMILMFWLAGNKVISVVLELFPIIFSYSIFFVSLCFNYRIRCFFTKANNVSIMCFLLLNSHQFVSVSSQDFNCSSRIANNR